VTFEEQDGRTLLVMSELYPSKEALDAAGGAAEATHETFAQLDELLVTLGVVDRGRYRPGGAGVPSSSGPPGERQRVRRHQLLAGHVPQRSMS
jgi:hypothetical protein